MIELYVSSRPILSSSYNVEHGDTNIFMPTYARPFRQLSHSIGAGTSRILEDRIMGFSDKNRRYASSNPTNNENEGGRSLIETSDDDGDGNDVMRPPIPNFGCDTGVNDMVGQLLYDGQYFATNLHDPNDDDDGFARYYASSWYETCRTT
uniref:Uncharacterized protein n=1 Tax=Populus trichocarpa TaxID=3694 RepID=B9GNV6_POPTR